MLVVRFIIFLVFIFVIIFLMSLLLPSRVTIAKTVTVNASVEKVANQITNFDEWKNWYPAFKNENISVAKKLPPPNVLSSVTLKDKQGKSITLNLIDTSKPRITVDLQSSSSTKVNYQFIITRKLNNQVELTWNVNTNLGLLPWKKIQGILLDKFSGKQYEEALDNLKKAAENN